MNWAPALVAGGLGGKATAPVMGQDHQKLQRMFHLSSNERPDGLDGHFGGIDVIRVISAGNYDRLNRLGLLLRMRNALSIHFGQFALISLLPNQKR